MDATILESERLLLRAFDLEDAKRVQELAGDRKISDTAIAVPHPYEDGMAEAWISTHGSLREEGKEWIFAITQKKLKRTVVEPSEQTRSSGSSALIGSIALRLNTIDQCAELGYWIGVPYWRQGFATEAAQCLLDFGFGELSLHRIQAHFLTRNRASGRVLEKLGMRHEGTMRDQQSTHHGFDDIEIMGITRAEFYAIRNRTI